MPAASAAPALDGPAFAQGLTRANILVDALTLLLLPVHEGINSLPLQVSIEQTDEAGERLCSTCLYAYHNNDHPLFSNHMQIETYASCAVCMNDNWNHLQTPLSAK
jgi:hypothetical protein